MILHLLYIALAIFFALTLARTIRSLLATPRVAAGVARAIQAVTPRTDPWGDEWSHDADTFERIVMADPDLMPPRSLGHRARAAWAAQQARLMRSRPEPQAIEGALIPPCRSLDARVSATLARADRVSADTQEMLAVRDEQHV